MIACATYPSGVFLNRSQTWNCLARVEKYAIRARNRFCIGTGHRRNSGKVLERIESRTLSCEHRLGISLDAHKRLADAGRALNTPSKKLLALAAFLALFIFNLPFPAVVLGAGAIGTVIAATRPELFALKPNDRPPPSAPRPWGASLRAIVVGLLVWIAPMAVVLALLGPDHVLWDVGLFFSKLAVVTFGGAYAVLAYMAQQAVDGFGWLNAREMADGLGLAETTPGPLIMVTQFVGYLAAFRAPEPFTPLFAGILGAALTTWVTFVPCFLWIFALAPWMERLEHAQRLKGGLAAVTAAVVGVIANLSVWFALHVLFSRVVDQDLGGLTLSVPEIASFDWRAGVLAAVAAVLIFRLRWNVLRVLGLTALGGLVLGQIF